MHYSTPLGVAHNVLHWSSNQHALCTASLVAVYAVRLIHTVPHTKTSFRILHRRTGPELLKLH